MNEPSPIVTFAAHTPQGQAPLTFSVKVRSGIAASRNRLIRDAAAVCAVLAASS